VRADRRASELERQRAGAPAGRRDDQTERRKDREAD